MPANNGKYEEAGVGLEILNQIQNVAQLIDRRLNPIEARLVQDERRRVFEFDLNLLTTGMIDVVQISDSHGAPWNFLDVGFAAQAEVPGYLVVGHGQMAGAGNKRVMARTDSGLVGPIIVFPFTTTTWTVGGDTRDLPTNEYPVWLAFVPFADPGGNRVMRVRGSIGLKV